MFYHTKLPDSPPCPPSLAREGGQGGESAKTMKDGYVTNTLKYYLALRFARNIIVLFDNAYFPGYDQWFTIIIRN